jgi:DNA-binding MarR family transcriptional regulator
MIEERLSLENSDEKVMVTGATAFSLYMHNAEKLAAATGLSYGDIIVLRHLHGRRDEINLRTLKENVMMLSGASITKITDKLVQKGYIHRRENPKSRREKLIKITQNGEKAFARLNKEISTLNEKAVKGFSSADKNSLFSDMKVILTNMFNVGIED